MKTDLMVKTFIYLGVVAQVLDLHHYFGESVINDENSFCSFVVRTEEWNQSLTDVQRGTGSILRVREAMFSNEQTGEAEARQFVVGDRPRLRFMAGCVVGQEG